MTRDRLTRLEPGQQTAARVAAVTCLLAMVVVVVSNFGISERLNVAGNAAETARNILAHETLFRLAIACDLVYGAVLGVLLTALYIVLEPAGRTLALVAAFSRLVYALMWVLMALNCFDALRLLSGADYLQVLEPQRLQALAKLTLGLRFDEYYVGLPFLALASTICSFLWFKSRYIPRALATFGVISSAWCMICALAFIVFPAFNKIVNDWLFDTPMALFEIALSCWLLLKGLRPAGAS